MTAMSTTRRPRGSLIVLGVLVALWVVWALWLLTAPDSNPGGQCSGLGFGCTLTPHDLAAFAGIIVVAPLSALTLVVTLVVRIVRIGRGSPRTVWDVVLGVLLLGAGLVWLVGTVVGSL
ncbi:MULTISPECIES: hypothetical protein [unclassified Knoellia]|uniref:hypothetical protein n=1 Tax=Knoellia altitudinis TaxID=3404795 RepID=UPI00360AE5B8